MGGALVFTVVLVGVLVIGTYLIQAAILLLQAAIWAALWTARIVFCIGAALVWCGWWVFDRREATSALQKAQAAEGRLNPRRVSA